MTRKIQSYIIIILSILLGSCVSEFTANLPSTDTNILAVNGSIVENTISEFYICKSFSLNEETQPEESFVSAKLILVGSDGYRSNPALYVGKGIHQLSVGVLNEEVSYSIEIECDGELYQSTPSRPLNTPEIDKVSWSQAVENEDISFFISTHDGLNKQSYFLWNYDEAWEFTANNFTNIFYDVVGDSLYEDRTGPTYYCWRYTKGAEEILLGSAESQEEKKIIDQLLYKKHPSEERFSSFYSVNVKQMSVTKEAYEYFQNKKKLNKEMGGLFTPQPSEIKGNIFCVTSPSKNVIGYINIAKCVTQKRIFIDRNEISRRFSSRECPEVNNSKSNAELYKSGLRPVGTQRDFITGLLQVDYWTPATCADCREVGGTKKRPDYWPNNHY